MSATNRGAIRHKDDYYCTPGWAVRAVLPELLPLLPREPLILEPSAGEGALVREWLSAGIRRDSIVAVELDRARAATCSEVLGTTVHICDFRDYAAACVRDDVSFDLVMTNPPFSLALEFVQASMKIVRPRGAVVMLLRTPWFGTQERAPWLRANTPTNNQLDRRPSFYEGAPPTPQAGLFGGEVTEDIDGSGSDNTEYSWFEWRLDEHGKLVRPTVRMLDCEKLPSKRRAA